jgi:hypothetical protein
MYKIKVDYIPENIYKEGLMYKAKIKVLFSDSDVVGDNDSVVLPFITHDFRIDNETPNTDERITNPVKNLDSLKDFIENSYIPFVERIIENKRRIKFESKKVETKYFEL